MAKYWKIGEIAEMTGLSIRTLRYYDQIKLLSPSEYTHSGHRRYSREDLQRLLEVLSFKKMGLSLEDISSLKEQGNASSIVEILSNQIERMKLDIKIQQNLLEQLQSVQKELANSKEERISIHSLTTLFELMKVNQAKYFNQRQIDSMRQHYQELDEAAIQKGEKEFKLVLDELRNRKERGLTSSNAEVQSLARRWQAIIDSISSNDHELRMSAERYYAENPEIAMSVGIEPSLYKYIQDALNDN
ncbi:MerR family transcriptional regulator [Geomicrobium sp. JSM 1781026]|uniref:MerR family transcriptional regulator n=1 Tax=Geomicrobium sp. JSM 1781026 TaxID=3344580 RepID=UPI0035C07E5E